MGKTDTEPDDIVEMTREFAREWAREIREATSRWQRFHCGDRVCVHGEVVPGPGPGLPGVIVGMYLDEDGRRVHHLVHLDNGMGRNAYLAEQMSALGRYVPR